MAGGSPPGGETAAGAAIGSVGSTTNGARGSPAAVGSSASLVGIITAGAAAVGWAGGPGAEAKSGAEGSGDSVAKEVTVAWIGPFDLDR